LKKDFVPPLASTLLKNPLPTWLKYHLTSRLFCVQFVSGAVTDKVLICRWLYIYLKVATATIPSNNKQGNKNI